MDSTNINEQIINQFIKIKLLNDIANALVNFGQSQGAQNFMDYVDMTCGAIPEGDFSQIIDMNSPDQFLELYMKIAEFRFAVAVTKLIEMNQAFLPAIKDFCFRTGKQCVENQITSVQQALKLINSRVLDGMYFDENKKIIESSESKIEWEKVNEVHQQYWEKAGGKVEVYYEMITSFIEGLLDGSEIKFTNQDNSMFFLYM